MSTQIDIVNQQLEVALSERPIINIDHITTEINLNNTSNNINLETNTQYIDVNILNDTIIDVALWNGISVYEDSSLIGSTRAIDFISGNNITLSTQKLSNKVLVTINSSGSGGGSGGHEIQEGGTPLTQRAGLNFNGSDFDLTDDAGNDRTDVRIASGYRDKLDNITITQPIDLDAIESRVNELDAAVILKGGWDASAGTFPGGGVAQAGWSYQVTVAGTVDGVQFSLNDRIIAIVDNASTAVFASNWLKADYSDLITSLDGQTGSLTLGGVINTLTAKTSLVDGDHVPVMDSAAGNASKKWSFANIKANLTSYFYTLYQPIDATLTALAELATGANKIPYSTGTDTFSQLDFKDEDDMASDSATALPSQQSVKAYVDAAQGVWRSLPTMTRTDGDTFTIPDTGNAGNWDKKLDRLTVIKWTDTTVHMAIVKSSSYASNVVTVEIAGDTLDNTFTTTSGYYTIIPAEKVTFAIAGTLATGTDLSRKWYADKAYRVLLGKANHGTAGTTNATTYDINKNGSTMFTTKLSVSSADTTGDDTTANDNTSLANEDYVTLDCDSVSTTAPVDAYIDLYLFPTNKVYL